MKDEDQFIPSKSECESNKRQCFNNLLDQEEVNFATNLFPVETFALAFAWCEWVINYLPYAREIVELLCNYCIVSVLQ